MPVGIDVFVEDGFATIDVVDPTLRVSTLNALLAATPVNLIQKLTRSGPRRQYRVPLGNATAAGLIDGSNSLDELTDRKDLGFAADLVAADPWGEQPTGFGEWKTQLPDVSETGYVASPTTVGPVTVADMTAAPQDANAIIEGPLRPNKPAATDGPQPPAQAAETTVKLQRRVRAKKIVTP